MISHQEQEEQEEEEEVLPMGFDEQYERMVKKQLGGLIGEYIKHSDGERVDKNKQNDNMCETVKEFQRLKANLAHP